MDIISLSQSIKESLDNTLETSNKVSQWYKEELNKLPFSIDVLSASLCSQRLKEIAHSRILYNLLQNSTLRIHFLNHFLLGVSFSPTSITIPYPDKHRIDLTIKGNTFFLIIENKVNGAVEQRKQIDNYVKIAQKTYPNEQIYVLYLGGEKSIEPSEFSLPHDTKALLGSRIICKNYKDDITPWVASVYEQIDFEKEPFLKSSLLSYRTYLENRYNLNPLHREMNNRLDKELISSLGIEAASLDEKISAIKDQIDNIDKIKERLTSLLEDYKGRQIRKWYEECVTITNGKLILTMQDSAEFGFNFRYRNTDFRCCVSFDDEPYWGIMGVVENANSKPKVFQELQNLILNSNRGFHNYEYNSEEWVISDYERNEMIVNRFITLIDIICNSESCSIL